MENGRPASWRHESPSSPARARFVPTKPVAAAQDIDNSSPLSCRSNGAVARLKQQFDDTQPTQPIIKARVTAGAIAQKKPTLPGAERVSRPPSSLGRNLPPDFGDAPPLPTSLSNGSLNGFEPNYAVNNAISQDTVSVCVRVRPTTKEAAWEVDERQKTVTFKGSDRSDSNFRFDGLITGSGNEEIYRTAAKSLIRSTMEGFDGVVFAYGQTASGKTFTLSGTQTAPGIIPQSVNDIFAYIRAHPQREFLLRASYLEIYNEQLRDLLAPETAGLVKIRQDESKRFFASPLREEVVTSVSQVEALLLRGEANRHTGTTDFNTRSSRSHTVFQMVIESRDASDGHKSLPRCTTPQPRRPTSKNAAVSDSSVTISRLSLIDLAGSEKATSQQERRLEGAFINKSLLTLEKVVSALTEETKRAHIPFRDSKLTQLLQPSLSGTAKVSVICTINPAVTMVEESRSTLKFASRVKKVTVAAEKNELLDDRALLVKYRNQIANLQAQLAQKTAEAAAIPPTPLRAPQDQRSHKLSAEIKKQADTLKEQIASLQTLFISSSNMDAERDEIMPRPVLSSLSVDESSPAENLMDKVLESEDKIADLEDTVSRLKAELAVVLEDLSTRPCISPDAPLDLKDEKIAAMEKTIREYEVILANVDVEDAAKRERRLVEREYAGRMRAVERERHASAASAAKLTELLRRETRRAKELENFILSHLTKEAEKLGSRRESLSSSGNSAITDLPSIMDEEAALSASFATMRDLAAYAN